MAKNLYKQNYKIGDFKLGVVVSETEGDVISYGHVTGFELNNLNETIIRVKWAEGDENAVHPHNVKIEK
jgi:hypothetical protein